MPVDLRAQTRDLFAEVDRHQQPITMADVFELADTRVIGVELPVGDSPIPVWVEDADPREPRRSLTVLRVALAAAVIILVLVGGVAWLSSGDDEPDVIDQSSTTVPPVAPDLSSSGKVVFVAGEAQGELTIVIMNGDGSDRRTLTPVAGSYRSPSVSRDGTQIAYVSGDSVTGADEAIYVMSADGSGVTRLLGDLYGESEPTWSPDGSRIAFSASPDGSVETRCYTEADGSGCGSGPRTEIYVVGSDGTNLTRLTDTAGDNRRPAWSPDGNRIAFTSSRDRENLNHIYVMNADGSEVTNLTQSVELSSDMDGGFFGSPAWSPRGDRIAFVGIANSDYRSHIFVMDADGANVTQLTAGASDDRRPTWIQDGSRIVFSRWEDNSTGAQLSSIDPDGSSVTVHTELGAFDGHFSWTDGTGPAATAATAPESAGPSPGSPTPIPPSIIAQVTTPSSIGDATWTVYEGATIAVTDVLRDEGISLPLRGEIVARATPPGLGDNYEIFQLDFADSVLVYVKQGDMDSLNDFEIWRSFDKENWENLGPAPSLPFGYHPRSITGSDELYIAYLDDATDTNEPGPDFLNSSSRNGIDWVPTSGLPAIEGSVHRVTNGWAWIPYWYSAVELEQSPTLSVYTSPDGTNWQPINTSQVPGTFDEENQTLSAWSSSGNALYATVQAGTPPKQRLWLLEFP